MREGRKLFKDDRNIFKEEEEMGERRRRKRRNDENREIGRF